MEKYLKRVADIVLRNKLASKGAVLIEGAKWCGKTTTASMQSKSIIYMHEPDKKRENIELSEIAPSKLLEGETPRLIDEWQITPNLWDAVRFEIDKRDKFSQFILTGSSVPADNTKIFHSGTGRISRMLMRPMSLYESLDSNGQVSLGDIFDNKKIEGKNCIDVEKLAFLICRGGWPKSLNVEDNIALSQSVDYYDAVVNVDISKVDGVRRNVLRIDNLMKVLARAVSSQMSLVSMQKDMSNNANIGLTDETIRSYINALEKIFVIENAKAWNPNLRSKTAIRFSDTWYFVDQSIATAALHIGPNDLINDIKTFGLLFENMCIRDLRVYADILDGNIYHYRDAKGLECDAVLHLKNGKYGLIEIKLGGDTLINEGINNLIAFDKNIDTTKMPAPSFKMIITGIGEYAYKRKDNIYIVPIGCLKY